MEGNEWPCLEVEVVEDLHGRLQRRRPTQARVQARRGGVVVVVVGGGGSGHGECGWCAACGCWYFFVKSCHQRITRLNESELNLTVQLDANSHNARERTDKYDDLTLSSAEGDRRWCSGAGEPSEQNRRNLLNQAKATVKQSGSPRAGNGGKRDLGARPSIQNKHARGATERVCQAASVISTWHRGGRESERRRVRWRREAGNVCPGWLLSCSSGTCNWGER